MEWIPQRWLQCVASCGLLATGCNLLDTAVLPQAAPPAVAREVVAPPPDPPPGAIVPASCPLGLPDTPLALEQLLTLAVQNHPDLAVARARAEAARGRLVQAGLYPNPSLTWEADEVGARSNAAGTEGPIFAQQIVTGRKLRLAQAAAAHGVAAADWQAMTRWFDVVTRVRLAHYEALTAQGEVRANEEVVRLAEGSLDAARKLQKAGTGTELDVLQTQVELDQSRVRLGVAQQRAEAAWKLLAVAIGMPELPARPLLGRLDLAVPSYDWQPVLEAVLSRSSELQEAHANVMQAEQLLQRARAENVPNVQLSLRPFYSFTDQTMQGRIEVGAVLPIWNRNQGNIFTAEADLARTQQEVRQVELRLTERLTLAYQRYRAARQQTEAYEKRILPNASESLRLVRIGYERGDPKYDYVALLQVQRTLAQARLAYVQALGDVWRGISEIQGLLQEDPPPCGTP